jgi:hypothetical protein
MKLKKVSVKQEALNRIRDDICMHLDLLCRDIKDIGKKLAPVDTGSLRDSIKFEGIDKNKVSGYIISDGKTQDGKDVDYWQHVHYGHMTSKKTWVPPNQFIFDAAKDAFNGGGLE